MTVRNRTPETFEIPPQSRSLAAGFDIPCVRQEQSNWCWAACIHMVLSQAKSQAQIVNAALDLTDCQINGSSSACNKALRLDGAPPSVSSALTSNGLSGTPVPDRLTEPELESALQDSPVIVAFNGGGAGGHVVLVVASDSGSGQTLFLVNDPRPANAHSAWKTHEEIRMGLSLGLGRWTETIHTLQ